MSCRFCFATFQDVKQERLPKGHLPRLQAIQVVRELATHFEKITFAGGEPTLCKWLPELLQVARDGGCTTMLVTNASQLTAAFLKDISHSLDWVTISVDSATTSTLSQLGRRTRSRVLSPEDYISAAQAVRDAGMRLKVNSVVTSLNAEEDLSSLILRMMPERWKIFQVLPVENQNGRIVQPLLVSIERFNHFVKRHEHLQEQGIVVVPEDNESMTGSYAMVDPAGRFFDNTQGTHVYSDPILEVGVENAWGNVTFRRDTYLERGGIYDW